MAQAHRKTWNGAAIAAPQAATISPMFNQLMSSLPGLTAAGAGTTFDFIFSSEVIPHPAWRQPLWNRNHSRGFRECGSIGGRHFKTYPHIVRKWSVGHVPILKIAPIQRN